MPTGNPKEDSQPDIASRSSGESKPLGIFGMKDFTELQTYSGRLQEDLDGVITTFETLSEMCDLTDDEKRK